jgi:starvation-inducible DNA-binding protein
MANLKKVVISDTPDPAGGGAKLISKPDERSGHCGDRLARLLNLRLKDALNLEWAAKQAHSLVKGPNFIALHGLFDEIYVNADAHAADLVAVIRSLGCEPAGQAAMPMRRKVAPYSDEASSGHTEVAGLVDRLRTLHRRLRSTATKASRLHEPEAAQACADMLHDVDKFRHLLESQLRLRH